MARDPENLAPPSPPPTPPAVTLGCPFPGSELSSFESEPEKPSGSDSELLLTGGRLILCLLFRSFLLRKKDSNSFNETFRKTFFFSL
jgi:hypothetical protein